ncbi:MAG: ABC transporter substrate-binding protein [Phototrophicaceae bacterium]
MKALRFVLVMMLAMLTVSSAMAQEGEVIRLIENSWSASALNVNVAKIILEEEYGYEVEIIALDEQAQWAAIAAGEADASLEVWPSGHAENVAEYIDELELVENVGELGVVGKIGWFVPTYVVEEYPELATYEGFLDKELVKIFATAETGDKGRFVGAAPSWVQYDAEIIANLEMNMEVVYAGSEEAILAELSSAYARQEPIVFYFYTPHSVFAEYDLTAVELPEHTEDCYAGVADGDASKVACDYPADQLFKIVSSDLAERAPEAYNLIKNFNYTSEDQIAMIAQVELEGLEFEEVAQAWVEENEEIWMEWLEAAEEE